MGNSKATKDKTTTVPDTAAPPSDASAEHPIARAFAALIIARDALIEARTTREAAGLEVVPDAAVLAQSLLGVGGALPDDSAPWTLAHALAELAGIPDADGTEALGRFASFVTSALMATRRRKSLKLPAPGLERFAAVASKCGTRKGAIEAMDALRAIDHASRERTNVDAFERRAAVQAAGPSSEAKAHAAAARAAQVQLDAELESRIGPVAMAARHGRSALPPNPLLAPPEADKV